MMTWKQWIIMNAYSVLTMTSGINYMQSTMMNVPMKRGRDLLYLHLYMAFTFVVSSFIGTREAGTTLIGFTSFFLLPVLFYGQRGRNIFLYGSISIVFSILLDITTAYTITLVLGADTFNRIINANSFQSYLFTTTVVGALSFILPWSYKICHAFFTRHSTSVRNGFLLLRPAALMLIMLSVFAYSVVQVGKQSTQYNIMEMTYTYALCIILLPVSITYFIQDMVYFRQKQRNQTLEQQKRINDALLANMRIFKHNIGNMLYGLEGEILSKDTGQIQSYYEELVTKLALIQNENIIMLQNMPVSSVTALILRQLEEAQQQEIPVYLFVQKGLTLRGLGQADLSAVLGVLIDNAREAAACSALPYVSIELRNVQTMTEIVVRNTYAGDAGSLTFGKSTKEGHMGLGLKSVRDVLKKQHGCYLNMRSVGQYVEAQLLLKK